MPQRAAGMRIEPPVSLPVVMVHCPEAAAEPDPPLEAAADQVGIPGVVHVAVVGVLAGGAVGELVHIQLAQQDGPRRPEAGGDGAVLGGHEGVVDAGAGRGSDSARVEQILEADGNPVQRPAVAPGADVALGLARRREGLVGQEGDERVEYRLRSPDAGKMGFDNLDRRNFAALNHRSQCPGAHVADFQFVHAIAPVRVIQSG